VKNRHKKKTKDKSKKIKVSSKYNNILFR